MPRAPLFASTALALALFPLATDTSGQGWTAGVPHPTWVEPESVPEPGEPSASKWGDTHYLLVDDQSLISPERIEHFYHRASQVVTTTGIDNLSQTLFELDPSFERLRIHGIWIHREGERIDALRPRELKAIQRERELNRQIYDGSVQVLAMLADVRVGDVVERSWTLSGRNPALGDDYAMWRRFGWDSPVAKRRARVRYRGERPLRIRYFNMALEPQVTRHGDWTDYRWARDDIPAQVYEDSQPSWLMTYPMAHLSTFDSWSEVAAWAYARYEPRVLARERMPTELLERVKKWETAETQEAKVSAALRFVQDEVRYMGIEIGASGYIPHDPAVVFERRFGDCKDKSLLLTSILRAMGIEAHVALVNTEWKQSLRDLPPSSFAFDHAIVAAELDGNRIWMDATSSLERGALRRRQPPDLGVALLVAEKTDDLATIPFPSLSKPDYEVTEHYGVREDGSALLDITTRARGSRADSARATFSRQPHDEIARDYLNYYADADPDIEQAEPLRVEDDESANVFTIHESYKIPHFWRDGARELWAESIDNNLDEPDIRVRSTPLGVRHPFWTQHRIRVSGVGRLDVKEGRWRLETPALRWRMEADTSAKQLELTWSLKSLSDHVEPENVAGHLEKVARIDDLSSYRIREEQANEISMTTAWGVMALLALVLGASLLAIRHKSHTGSGTQPAAQPPFQSGFRPGESPQTAVQGRLAEVVPRLRCSCGGGYAQVDPAPTRIRYEESELLLTTLECRLCKDRHDYYLADRAAAG